MGTFIDDILGVGTLTPDSKVQIAEEIEGLPLGDWIAGPAAENNSWQGVTFGNGLYVAVSSSGTNRVMISPNGVNWTSQSAAENNSWLGVTFGNGLFVAVADSGTNRLMTSPDGITWTALLIPIGFWTAITFGNNLFVATGLTGGANQVITSPDGITWTAQTPANLNRWNAITFGNGLFVSVADDFDTDTIMTSPDGITWTERTSPIVQQLEGVTFGNNLFVAVGRAGIDVITSPDGITWTSHTGVSLISWKAITFGNGFFVAVSLSGSGNRSMTSTDGINWITEAIEDNQWNSITFGGDRFITVSSNGADRVEVLPFVGISNAVLKLDSTVSGFLPPRMTTAERDFIQSPNAGLLIFNITSLQTEVFDGTAWRPLGASSVNVFGFVNGNNATTPITNDTYDTISVNGFANNGTFPSFTLTTPNDALYTYDDPAPFNGTMTANLSATKNVTSDNYRFAISINGAIPVFATAVYKRSRSWKAPCRCRPGASPPRSNSTTNMQSAARTPSSTKVRTMSFR